ncbi:MAG: ABC transporter permease subunit [Lachnospiraceae bacterium]|nr:ABC transporter permease subunit [Lachnospiraceae bacterium]
MIAIFKREFKSYFTSMTGYLFMAFILFFEGLYFVAYNVTQGYPHFAYTLYSLNFVYMIAVPILTMRVFADERRQRTDQLLLTAPVTVTQIVLGKYLAMVAVYGIVCAISALGPAVLTMFGTVYLAGDYGMLLAFFLAGCAFLAIGMYISALTESPVLACVGTFGVLLILYLISSIASMIPIDAIANVLTEFSFSDRLYSFTQNLIDVPSYVFFASVAGYFVFLTVQSVQKRRWN